MGHLIGVSLEGFKIAYIVHVNVVYMVRPVPRNIPNSNYFVQLPKVVRAWGVLYILTSKCPSHHNGVQLFISHLASWLCTRRFSEPTFRPSGATKHWKKHSVSRLPYLFAHLHLLSSDFLHLLSSPSLIFSLLTFSTSEFLPDSASSWLCFSSVQIVGSFTSKLPSITPANSLWWNHYRKPKHKIVVGL